MNIGMSDLKSMRDELRKLRKDHVKPVSRMKKADISSEIEKLRVARNETPAAAAVPSAPIKKSKAAVETIKEAKVSEFPVKPVEAKAEKKVPMTKSGMGAKKKPSKMDKLMKMLEAISSSDEE